MQICCLDWNWKKCRWISYLQLDIFCSGAGGAGLGSEPSLQPDTMFCCVFFVQRSVCCQPLLFRGGGGTGIDQSLSDCRCVTHWARFDAAGDHQRCSLQELSRSRWVCLLAFFQQIRGFKTYVFTVWTRSVAISGFYYKIIFTKTIDSNDIITLSIEKNNNNAFTQIHLYLCSMSTDCLNLTDFY